MREKLNKYRSFVKTTKGIYSLVGLFVLFLFLIVALQQQHLADQASINQPTTRESEVNTVQITSEPPTPTTTPFNRPSIIPTRRPIATPTPTATPTETPTITPAPTASMPTLIVRNGEELTFKIDYDSRAGAVSNYRYDPTPLSPYLSFMWSGIPYIYKIGDHVEETFHFRALRPGETKLVIYRSQENGSLIAEYVYWVIIEP